MTQHATRGAALSGGAARTAGAGGAGGASPGLLTRRYSVPETIMRKYKLAQRNAESDECAPSLTSRASSPARAPVAPRDLIRSALMRRMRGFPSLPPDAPPACACRSLEALPSPATPPRARVGLSDTDREYFSDCTYQSHGAPPRVSAGHVDDSSELVEKKLPPAPVLLQPPPSTYEFLEIVVSETLDSSLYDDSSPHEKSVQPPMSLPPQSGLHGLELDQYVSEILVSSLNSLSDQLQQMSASMGRDGRLCVVEKEIKVKLQNTGVNTIVHLSPTSNHQIIFGNEELYHRDEPRDVCNNSHDVVGERSNSPSPCAASPSPATPRDFNYNETPPHDAVNRAVLQQIQRLFQEEMCQSPTAPPAAPEGALVEEAATHAVLEQHSDVDEYLQSVGAGTYSAPVVPRRCALPASDSMEVNTSSSDNEPPPSDCTSLVDSLDDPRSPRSPRRPLRPSPCRAASLVRSTIDVLDLLPETAPSASPEPAPPQREPEAYFVRISKDSLACDTAVPPPRLPERIRERLARRQRRRELRAEGARGGDAGDIAREIDRKQYNSAVRARRRLDRDCMTIVNALVDELIAKIAQDELKYMRIKKKTTETAERNKRKWKRSSESLDGRDTRLCAARFRGERSPGLRGRLALHPPATPMPPAPASRRLYQKSEIHEGSKRIEILEILEYVEPSMSSQESGSDSSQGQTRVRRSRIPVPVSAPRPPLQAASTRPRAYSVPSLAPSSPPESPPRRRGSLPAPTPPARFRQIFDMIPEERSSFSLESSTSEGGAVRRSRGTSPPPAPPPPPRRHQLTMTSPRHRSAATSPPAPLPVPLPAPLPAAVPTLWTHAEGSEEKPEQKLEANKVPESRSASTQYEPEPLPPAELSSHDAPHGPLPITDRKAQNCSPPSSEGKKYVDTFPDENLKVQNKILPPPKEKKQFNTKTLRRDRNKLDSHRVPKLNEVRKSRELLPPRPSPPPPSPPRGSRGARSRSSSSESSGSLLCALAPRWLPGKRHRRKDARTTLPQTDATVSNNVKREDSSKGGWSVTLCGGTRTALPRDVEMRLRFPTPAPSYPDTHAHAAHPAPAAPCPCRHCEPALPPAPAAATLTLRNQSTDSSVLASKSTRKSTETLPELETYRASRTRTNRSVKMRRACSLHCWLPPSAQQPLRCSNGLSVLGCGIVPELRPSRRRRP